MPEPKRMFGFINWNRDHAAKVAEMGFKPEDVIYCSNKEPPKEGDMWHPYTALKAPLNLAAAKNLVIKKAKEMKADTLFIIEDDVLVTEVGFRNLSAGLPSDTAAVERWMQRVWAQGAR